MTYRDSTYPFPFGGGRYGQHRTTAATASGDPAQESGGGADDGAAQAGPSAYTRFSHHAYGTNSGYYNAVAQARAGAIIPVAHAMLMQQAQLAQQNQGYVTPPPIIQKPIENAGISAGEIIGWRAWFLKDGLLHSMFASAIWPPHEPMTGDVEGGTGVHAFKSQRATVEEYGNPLGCLVIGRVALWGTVIEHEFGYRAEFGRVESLVMAVNLKPGQLDELRELYCPQPAGIIK